MNKKRSKKIQKKYDERKKNAKISSLLEEQFQQGKLLGELAKGLGWGQAPEALAVCPSLGQGWRCLEKSMGGLRGCLSDESFVQFCY